MGSPEGITSITHYKAIPSVLLPSAYTAKLVAQLESEREMEPASIKTALPGRAVFRAGVLRPAFGQPPSLGTLRDESPRDRCSRLEQKFQSNGKCVAWQGLAVGDSPTRPKLAFAS